MFSTPLPIYDHVETVTKIRTNRLGPVGCLQVDSSLFPPLEVLGRWMDLLSLRGVKELVMLDVTRASIISPTQQTVT